MKLNVRDELQHLSIDEITNEYRNNCNKDAVMCINIQGEFNIGTIVRTASLFGMDSVILIGKRSYDQRTTVGMHNYIKIDKISATKGYHNDELNVDIIITKLKEYSLKYKIIFVEQGGVDIRNLNVLVDKKIPTMFVMGTENSGIPKEILEKKDELNGIIASITQHGVGRSFNVGVAFGIVAYEFYR